MTLYEEMKQAEEQIEQDETLTEQEKSDLFREYVLLQMMAGRFGAYYRPCSYTDFESYVNVELNDFADCINYFYEKDEPFDYDDVIERLKYDFDDVTYGCSEYFKFDIEKGKKYIRFED